MSRSHVLTFGVLVALASSGFASAVAAQPAGATIHVHAVEPPLSVTPETGGLPGLQLRVTFSLLDANGTVMKEAIENATLQVADARYSSKFSKLESPWSVVLLLDTSGTMGTGRAFTDFLTLRDSLSRSLGSAPAGASFALIPFASRAPTVVEFTADRDKLGAALKGLRPQFGQPACLNDAVFEAVAKLSSAPGRRAVFAVTASADSCATRTSLEVADFAQRNRVEVYAVGVDSYTITRQALDALTLPTGGFSETRGASELTFALDNLVSVLGNQWQAVWVVYPSEGPQTGELNVKLPDTTVISGTVDFVSDRTYARPPTVAIAGTAQSTLGGVRFNLDIINPEKIAAIDVNLISQLTGRPVYQDRITELSESILLPADDLVQGGEYALTLSALDEQGQVLSQTEPLEFTYNPAAPSLNATVQTWPTAESPYFIISIAVANLDGVASFRMWLEQEQGSAPIRGTEVTIPSGQALQLPVGGVRSGSYVVRIQALDDGERLLAESTGLKVNYRAPGLVARLVASLQGSLLAVLAVCGLGVMAVVGLGGLAWFLIPRGRGVRNVELVMPEKPRGAPKPPEPAAPAASARVASKPAAAAAPAPSRPKPPAAVPQRPPTPPAPPPPPPAEKPSPGPDLPQRTPGAVSSASEAMPVQGLAVVEMADPGLGPFHAEIRKSPFRIGRASDNDGVVPVGSTSGVSGHHCVIRFEDGRWTVQDDQSRFGTTVNGQPVPKGKPFDLPDGAMVGLGPRLRIRFRIETGSGKVQAS